MPPTTSRAVLITGCSSGIGRATAERLNAAGWTVYATARRRETLAELEAAGCRTLALDVTDEASMQAAVRAVEDADGAVGVAGQQRRLQPVGRRRVRPGRAAPPPVRDERLRRPAHGQLVLPGMRARAGARWSTSPRWAGG